jgi:hypothetical protein
MGKFDAVKSAQLGMPISTARTRLVKMLLFRELQHSGNVTCFKCGDSIEDIDHLSIEHKVPWLHGSPDLFWSLDNVTFSHTFCNNPDRMYITQAASIAAKKARSNRKPDSSTSWCYECRQQLPVSDFTKNSSNVNGLDDSCKRCRSVRRGSVAK